MSAPELRDSIEIYRDEFGLVQDKRGPAPRRADTHGNGILFSSLYLILLSRLGDLTDRDSGEFMQSFLQCRAMNARHELVPGLFRRSPTNTDAEAQDDLVALAYASYLCGLPFAFEMVEWGERRTEDFPWFKWCYNNANPGYFHFQSWLGRFPHYVGHLLACGRQEIPLFPQAYAPLALAATNAIGKTDDDTWILNWIVASGPLGAHPLVAPGVRVFFRRLDAIGGLKSVLLRNWPDHPIARHWV